MMATAKWERDHLAAMTTPRGMERPLVLIRDALMEYAVLYQQQFESKVGEDGVLGNHWMQIANGLVGLLNGPTGRIDCGTLDGAVRLLARAAGFTDAEADALSTDIEFGI